MTVEAIAPSRIGIFGGGTDLPAYAEQWGGICLNMAINIRHRVVLPGDGEILKEDSKEFIEAFVDQEINHTYDGLIESGLGSSASLAVALVAAQARFDGEKLSPFEIAERAWNTEVNRLKLFGGKQDQYAAALGGINVMEFGQEVKIHPLSRDFADKIVPHLALFHTGLKRKNPKIQEGLRALTDDQVFHLTVVKNMAVQGIEAIANGDINKVAELMKQAWESKKLSNRGVTNEEIDKIYDQGISAGAYAGKLLGSGGGGHILFVVAQENKETFIKKMEEKGLKWVDFSIDWNGVQTRILES